MNIDLRLSYVSVFTGQTLTLYDSPATSGVPRAEPTSHENAMSAYTRWLQEQVSSRLSAMHNILRWVQRNVSTNSCTQCIHSIFIIHVVTQARHKCPFDLRMDDLHIGYNINRLRLFRDVPMVDDGINVHMYMKLQNVS